MGEGRGIISAEYSTEESIDLLISDGIESIALQLSDQKSENKKNKRSFFSRINKPILFIWIWLVWGLLPV